MSGGQDTSRRRRVIVVASAGGHWVQLMRMRPAWARCDVTYITTIAGYRDWLMSDAQERGEPEPVYRVVPDANRWQPFRLLRLLVSLTFLVIRVRPDAVISTGAAPGYFALRIAAFLGARTAWIDSIANADELSWSGRRIGRYADVWLTQWPHLAGTERSEGPRYCGSVL